MKRVFAFALLLAAAGYAEVQQEFHKTYPLSTDGKVSVKNVNGSVFITATDRQDVQVDAVKRGHTQQSLDDAKIVVDSTANSVSVRTQYPEHCHDCASVEYRLSVPRHARLDAIETVNGRVEIDGASGGIRASSTNGNVVLRRVEGDADLQTVNGRVEADFARLGKAVKAETVNGGVQLALPSGAGARLTAKTVHGSVRSDFDLPVRHIGFGPGRTIETTIGGGGADISIVTVNGSIDLKRN